MNDAYLRKGSQTLLEQRVMSHTLNMSEMLCGVDHKDETTCLDVVSIVQSFTQHAQRVGLDRLLEMVLLGENEALFRALHGIRRIRRDLACDLECGG